MNTVWIDFVEYHADEEGKPLLCPYDNQPIPAYVCICAAHGSSECCCGAWDRPLPEDGEE